MKKYQSLKIKQLLIYVLIVLLLIIYIFFLTSCQKNDSINIPNIEESPLITEVIIDIKGEVVFPGVYILPNGSLINDAIKLAGGLTNEANIKEINLAQVLVSNQMIIIPSIIEVVDQRETNNKININKASLKELTTLTSIGNVKAQNIINYRNEKGNFKTIEEIKQVKGIGEDIFETIKDLISIS